MFAVVRMWLSQAAGWYDRVIGYLGKLADQYCLQGYHKVLYRTKDGWQESRRGWLCLLGVGALRQPKKPSRSRPIDTTTTTPAQLQYGRDAWYDQCISREYMLLKAYGTRLYSRACKIYGVALFDM
jgi:hypothetical protein